MWLYIWLTSRKQKQQEGASKSDTRSDQVALLYNNDAKIRMVLTKCRHHCGCLISPLQWRHNGRDSVSNHQPHDCLLNRLFRRRSKKTSKLRVTGLCAGNSRGIGEFPVQMASNAEKVFIWWRHHGWCYSWSNYRKHLKWIEVCNYIFYNKYNFIHFHPDVFYLGYYYLWHCTLVSSTP